MPTCKEVTHLASQALDENLSFSEWFRMRIHLMICKACGRYVKQLHFLRRAVALFSEQEQRSVVQHKMPQDCRDRIHAELVARRGQG